MHQFRLVHIGVAAALAAATVTAIGVVQAVGATSGGTAASVFVPIAPCRLLDTRAGADNVGTRNTPLAATETATFAVWGTNGNCAIPSSATGIATNATAVNPTAASYVTIFPADANPRPTASNLNVVAGGAPTPNQVTVGLSAAGAISIYNNGGTVDMIIDIVGYYQAASASGSGAQGPQGPTGPQGPQGTPGATGPAGPTCPAGGCVAYYLGHDVVTKENGAMPSPVVDVGGCFHLSPGGHAQVSLHLPGGAKPISVVVTAFDNAPGSITSYSLWSDDTATGAEGYRSLITQTDNVGTRARYSLQLFDNLPPQSSSASYVLDMKEANNGYGTNQIFCAAQVTYTF